MIARRSQPARPDHGGLPRLRHRQAFLLRHGDNMERFRAIIDNGPHAVSDKGTDAAVCVIDNKANLFVGGKLVQIVQTSSGQPYFREVG